MRIISRLLATFFLSLVLTTAAGAEPASPLDLVKNSKRILFLGDSITASGQYVAAFDAWLVSNRWEKTPQVINCGLPSETVSGLSEEGHAGGKFPRPDLFERLDRVLDLVKPDLVFACYGINCGIYQPFHEGRFEKYQQGWKKLKEKVEAAGGKLIVITPPFYDDMRSPKAGFSYNEVLDRYSAWLVKQRDTGWTVIDLHSGMTEFVKIQREKDPMFTLQPDGVHPSPEGHWLMAQLLLAALGDEEKIMPAGDLRLARSHHFRYWGKRGISPNAYGLISQRMETLRDAYVATAGHKRPGVATGAPLEDAKKNAEKLTRWIEEELKK